MGNFLFWKWGQKENKEVKFEYLPIEQATIDKVNEALKTLDDRNEKLAFSLPGGGALGSIQAGQLAYFNQLGILKHCKMFCGTSVGGLNTLVAANSADFQRVIDLWMNIKENKDVYDGILEGGLGGLLAIVGQTFKDNGGKCVLKPNGLNKILSNEFGDKLIDDLPVEVAVTATNMSTGKMEMFHSKVNGNISAKTVALMTSAIPIAFPSVEWNGDWYNDGGLGQNSSVNVAIENGATKVIIVGTAPDQMDRINIKTDVVSIGSRMPGVIMSVFEEWAWREIEIYQEMCKLDPNKPKIEFFDSYPDFDGGSALEFRNCRMNFIKGYEYAYKNTDIDKLIKFIHD